MQFYIYVAYVVHSFTHFVAVHMSEFAYIFMETCTVYMYSSRSESFIISYILSLINPPHLKLGNQPSCHNFNIFVQPKLWQPCDFSPYLVVQAMFCWLLFVGCCLLFVVVVCLLVVVCGLSLLFVCWLLFVCCVVLHFLMYRSTHPQRGISASIVTALFNRRLAQLAQQKGIELPEASGKIWVKKKLWTQKWLNHLGLQLNQFQIGDKFWICCFFWDVYWMSKLLNHWMTLKVLKCFEMFKSSQFVFFNMGYWNRLDFVRSNFGWKLSISWR